MDNGIIIRRMNQDVISTVIEEGFQSFNDAMNTNYSFDNVKIAYCTAASIGKVYKEFTAQYGFYQEEKTKEMLGNELAEAFVGQTDCDDPNHVDGILIRTDAPDDMDNQDSYMSVIIHELSHIFCTTHEIPTAGKDGQQFFDLYCTSISITKEERIRDDYIYAGYAIWRELIASILQDIIFQQPSFCIYELQPTILKLAEHVKPGYPEAKEAMYRILTMVMNSREGGESEKWIELKRTLQEESIPFIPVIEIVFEKLHQPQKIYEITPEFIMELGRAYKVALIGNAIIAYD